MARLNWDKARRNQRASGSRAVKSRPFKQYRKPKPKLENDGLIWPAYVTESDGQGGLTVHGFRNRAEADAAGFPWVGR